LKISMADFIIQEHKSPIFFISKIWHLD
jgi:hypothetical protein